MVKEVSDDVYLIEKANECDMHELVRLQIRAFASDRALCGSGPPGYDSYDHQRYAASCYQYYVIKQNSQRVGGFYFLYQSGILQLIRLFIAPDYQGRGMGQMVLEFLKAHVLPGEVIELETPTFSVGAQRFYEKQGFQRIKRIQYGASDAYLYRLIVT